MSESTNWMDALNALMEERNRYEQWITQLDARKGTTPTHVFARVRADYDARLAKVLDQLAGRATELQSTASTLAEKVAALYADETTLRDERAEAELRAMVGEFSLDHARDAMQRCDEAISSLGAERAQLGAELGRVQEILAVAVRPPTPPAGEEPVIPIEALAPARTVVPPHSVVPPVTPAAQPATSPPPGPVRPVPASGFDELAFLQSVVDRPAPTRPADAGHAAPGPRVDNRPEIRGEPANARAAMIERVDVEVPAGMNGAARRGVAPTPVLTSTPLVEKEVQQPDSALTPGSIPAFLKDLPTEQIKTLKCQECGTMNYPTEWYCERCGGELAAM